MPKYFDFVNKQSGKPLPEQEELYKLWATKQQSKMPKDFILKMKPLPQHPEEPEMEEQTKLNLDLQRQALEKIRAKAMGEMGAVSDKDIQTFDTSKNITKKFQDNEQDDKQTFDDLESPHPERMKEIIRKMLKDEELSQDEDEDLQLFYHNEVADQPKEEFDESKLYDALDYFSSPSMEQREGREPKEFPAILDLSPEEKAELRKRLVK